MHIKYFLVLVFLNLCQVWTSYGANILFFWGVSTLSHRIIVWPLVKNLAERGHNITFLSPFNLNISYPKINEIVLKSKSKVGLLSNSNQTLFDMRLENTHSSIWNELFEYGVSYCEAVTESPEIINWVKSSQYDLVVINSLFNDCALGLAYKFKAPHIIFGTSSVFMWLYDMGGFPAETSSIPNLSSDYVQPMTFFQKVVNTLDPIYWTLMRHWVMFPKLEAMLQNALDMPDMPSLKQLEQESALLLLNNHYSSDYARSLPPSVVSVGGMHCSNVTKPLPKNILDLIESGGEEGFIYVSFGSTARFSEAPQQIKNIFFKAFRNAPIRFVWKWESEVPPEMPDNVLTAKWMPQQDILAHPKIRAFITHAGLLSTQEATFFGVPLIAFPLFAEQDYNADRLAAIGIGIRLEIRELTLSTFESALNSILTDSRYKIKMKETSTMFKNRPMSPLETAVWWTEFILKHKQAGSYLKPLAVNQTWYERRCLDVWLFVFLVVLCIALSANVIVTKILRSLMRSATNHKVDAQQFVENRKEKRS